MINRLYTHKSTQSVLTQVVTLSEAQRRWGKARKTLRIACDKGYLNYVKQGRIILIEVASLERHWGAPR